MSTRALVAVALGGAISARALRVPSRRGDLLAVIGAADNPILVDLLSARLLGGLVRWAGGTVVR